MPGPSIPHNTHSAKWLAHVSALGQACLTCALPFSSAQPWDINMLRGVFFISSSKGRSCGFDFCTCEEYGSRLYGFISLCWSWLSFLFNTTLANRHSLHVNTLIASSSSSSSFHTHTPRHVQAHAQANTQRHTHAHTLLDLWFPWVWAVNGETATYQRQL